MIGFFKNRMAKNGKHLPTKEKSPKIHKTATVRTSQIVGDVTIKENVHIVNAVIRADEGAPFFIEKNSNIQDFVVLHGYTTQHHGEKIPENLVTVPDKGEFSIYIDEHVTVGHGALIHGPCYIGKDTFIGFKSAIDAATIGSNVEIGAHAYIKKVKIPDNIAIAPNAVILKEEDIAKFEVERTNINRTVVHVNMEMAEAYKEYL